MADKKGKLEEEIERLKAEVVSLRELDKERKLKGGKIKENVSSKSKIDGDVNDGAKHIRLACNEYELLHTEVKRDLLEKTLVMKAVSVWKLEVESSFLDMDDLIQAGFSSGNEVHLLQEGEIKLSQKYICWIKATHFFMVGRME
ncbi:hypothetical protein FHG87_003890 [Trinorchestia longiramus]|nr:hypothetical protein FHG87_003890 [Trinorchestia longiramus]